MFTDEHVVIAIFNALTHSLLLAVYLKDKTTTLSSQRLMCQMHSWLLNYSTAFTPGQP